MGGDGGNEVVFSSFHTQLQQMKETVSEYFKKVSNYVTHTKTYFMNEIH